MKVIHIVLVALALLAGNFVKQEWDGLKVRLDRAEATITDTANQGTSTLKTMEDTINDLKARVFRSESTGQCPAPDPEIGKRLDELERLVAEIAESKAPVQSQPTPAKPTIVMHSSPTCAPCRTWLALNAPEWTRKGWTIHIIEEKFSENPWPWFEVYDGNKKTVVKEFLTEESYKRAQR